VSNVNCDACAHAEVKILNAKLRRGESVALLAQRFEVSTNVLAVHRLHVEGRRVYGDWESIVDHLVELKEIAEQRLKETEESRDAAALIRELRGIDSDIIKITQPHKGCISPSLWTDLRSAIMNVLKEHPAVMEQVALAVMGVEEARNGSGRS
jgi:hypothetical protein